MIKKRGVEKLVFLSIFLLVLSPIVSAGLGIKYSAQSAMVREGQEVCLDYYSVYNPWDDETYVKIGVSEELQEILTVQNTEAILVPAQTSNTESIPIKFCFKVPRVYAKDCLAGPFICEQTCSEEIKVYDGDVVLTSVPSPLMASGMGGSATQMSISAPLTLRVECAAHARDYTLLWVVIAAIAAIVLAVVLIKRNQKPEIERDREKLAKLRAKIEKEETKPKKSKTKKKKK